MNIDKLIEQLSLGKWLDQKTLLLICEKIKEIIMEESNVQPIFSPVNVCGNIHGQFYDLLQLFRAGGPLQKTNYVFLGDYVNRGINSVQTFSYLLCLKVKFPQKITLLRGHHQQKNMTLENGFYNEIYRKYRNYNPWRYFTEVFQYLPFSAIIDNSIFCVHAGLSPQITHVDSIRIIDRNKQSPCEEGVLADLCWSDPEEIEDWGLNPRGLGWLFGSQPAKQFCHINDFKLIARSHQLSMQGYFHWFTDKNVVTIWSAPNFVYRCGNSAAIMEVAQHTQNVFTIFKSTPQSQSSLYKYWKLK